MVGELVVRGKPQQRSPLDAKPSVTGVLGAGNTEIPNDILTPMVKSNSVVVYKVNPVLALSSAVKERIFAPLIQRGYLAFVYGGAPQGKAVTECCEVESLVLTGSHVTYDRIVWNDRDKANPEVTPALTKPVHAELGSVN